MEPFRVHILGCGSALPTLHHNASAQVVEIRGKLFLVDCGEGTQVQLRRSHLRFTKISAVFITHLHGDHCFGLIGMLSTFGLLGRTARLAIYAPAALEDMLKEYEGTLIFVTHDRYLVREVADSLIIFEGNGAEYFPFNYEEYERERGREKADKPENVWNIGHAEKPEAENSEQPAEPKKKSVNLGKERSRMERRIARLEVLLEENDSKKAALEEELNDPANASAYKKLEELQSQIDALNTQDDEYMAEWEQLNEKLGEM